MSKQMTSTEVSNNDEERYYPIGFIENESDPSKINMFIKSNHGKRMTLELCNFTDYHKGAIEKMTAILKEGIELGKL